MNKRFTVEEKAGLIEHALRLRSDGLSCKSIGDILGISHSTVHRWLNSDAAKKHRDYNRKHALEHYHSNLIEEREKNKRYYWANRSAFHARYKRNYDKSPDARKEYSRQYRANNIEKIRLRSQTNRWQIAAATAMRRARKKSATPCWLSVEHKKQIRKLYEEACWLTNETGMQHEVDHIHPLNHASLCGLHVPWNLRVITKIENRAKCNQFIPSLGLTGQQESRSLD